LKKLTVGSAVVELIQGDITAQETDAIVNAANSRLAPGGGVAGAIHRAAGPGLWEECKPLGGCATGEAKITGGHNLKARYVIHTVGPVYSGSEKDPQLLASCYTNSLKLAVEHGLDSVSFPAISTGVFGYPIQEAAKVSLKAVTGFLRQHGKPSLVRFVLYSPQDLEVFSQAATEIS